MNALIEKFKSKVMDNDILSRIALTPIFFLWYPVLMISYENEKVRKDCITAMVLTAYFFLFLLLGGLLYWIPVIGTILANLFHFIGVIFYIGFSSFFIYSIKNEKKMVLKLINTPVSKIDSFLHS
ncbi:MAG: hypothetical protein H7A24_00750 [Leptospiraceae bacterium]|nr:hypothetical protein [Leptospiraceae bacterium]MCP5510381.1 hypothetical protein [Leptospiraceae bacterium]